MKALNFLQAYTASSWNLEVNLDKYHDQLSRKFNPKMVVDLFENWQKTQWIAGMPLYQIDNTTRFWIDYNKAYYSIRKDGAMWRDGNWSLYLTCIGSLEHALVTLKQTTLT